MCYYRFQFNGYDKRQNDFDGDMLKIVKQINFYLKEGLVVFIESSCKPISDVLGMFRGDDPVDGDT